MFCVVSRWVCVLKAKDYIVHSPSIWLEWTNMWMIPANALVLSSFPCYASSTQGVGGGKHLGRSEMVRKG